jgi:glycosyltransferase involved in cell wall biosynthesis
VSDPVRLLRLKREVRPLRGFDVLYCNSITSALALRVLPDIPPTVISHVHELDSAVEHWVDAEDRRSMIDHSSAFVVAAECVGRNLVDNHGVDPSRVHCCYEFVDPPFAIEGRVAEAREQLRLSDEELVVGAVGTADWRKGADLFIQVAARVVESSPGTKVRFVWVGRALPHDLENHLDDLRTLGLSDVVTFIGEVPDPASYMSLFDVFCLTSREDPFPLVCLEAGALSVPVVTFENGGMVELAVADGVHDPLLTAVPYLDVEGMADAVAALLADRSGAKAMGARLRDWVVDHHMSSVGAAAVGAVVDGLLAAPAVTIDRVDRS